MAVIELTPKFLVLGGKNASDDVREARDKGKGSNA